MDLALASGVGRVVLLGKLGMHRRGATRFGRYHARIACPTAIIVGARSRRMFHDAARRLAAALPSARLSEVARADHLINLFQPDDLARADPNGWQLLESPMPARSTGGLAAASFSRPPLMG